MAFKGELYIEGPDGPLKGPRENDSSLVYEFTHGAYLPYDREGQRIQGSRRITAFTLTKDVDKMTPVLFQYCCEGTLIKKATILLYRIKEAGTEVPYFKYDLENAQIVSVKDYMPTTKYKDNENIGHLEEVKIDAERYSYSFEDTIQFQDSSVLVGGK